MSLSEPNLKLRHQRFWERHRHAVRRSCSHGAGRAVAEVGGRRIRLLPLAVLPGLCPSLSNVPPQRGPWPCLTLLHLSPQHCHYLVGHRRSTFSCVKSWGQACFRIQNPQMIQGYLVQNTSRRKHPTPRVQSSTPHPITWTSSLQDRRTRQGGEIKAPKALHLAHIRSSSQWSCEKTAFSGPWTSEV